MTFADGSVGASLKEQRRNKKGKNIVFFITEKCVKIIIIKLNSFLNFFFYVPSHNNKRLSFAPLTFDKKSFARFSKRYSSRDVSTMTSGSSSQTVVAVDPSTFGANISSLISFQNNFTYRYEVNEKEHEKKMCHYNMLLFSL